MLKRVRGVYCVTMATGESGLCFSFFLTFQVERCTEVCACVCGRGINELHVCAATG